MKKLFVLLMGLMVLGACATTPKYEGVFVPKEYADQFEPGEKGTTASLRWIRPGVNFAKYNKVMVDYVTFALAPDSNYKGIDANEMKTLADAASLALVNAFKEKYPVVSEPAPDVLRFKFAIVDLKQSRPGMSATVLVVPLGIGMNVVKKGVTGGWIGSGLTKAEALVIDSSTNELVAAGYDDYSAKFTERFSKWGSVEDAFKHWGEIVTQTLENLKAGVVKK